MEPIQQADQTSAPPKGGRFVASLVVFWDGKSENMEIRDPYTNALWGYIPRLFLTEVSRCL